MSQLRSDFRFFHRMRVRWAEVDMQKIVFNAHYLMYFDTAVADYWRALALPYEASMQHLGGDLYVKKATLEYHASAHYDEQLDIGLRCARIGTSSVLFEGAIFHGDALLVSTELVYVFADPATQRAKPVPLALREIFEHHAAGQPLVQVETGPWEPVQAAISELRREVFVQEQGIATDLVWDAHDPGALHVLARNRLGQPVGSGRLLQEAPGVGRIGRMAVHKVLRGAHFGQAVLNALIAAARARGDHVVVLHAQRSAEGFYTRSGFSARGQVFEAAGIAHIEMALDLSRP